MLGHVIKAGGGEVRRRTGARHPRDASRRRRASSRRSWSRRFVSDTPPPALVDRAAARFRGHERRPARGDAHDPDVAGVPRRRTRTARRSRRRSSSSSARCARRAPTCRTRCRSCARCSSSACRSISASRRPATRTRPTRGSTPARSSSRMNFALRLASGKMRGVSRHVARSRSMLDGDLSETTRATIARATDAATGRGADARRAGISATEVMTCMSPDESF